MIKSNFSGWVIKGRKREKEEGGREGRKRKGRTAEGEKGEGGEEEGITKLEEEYGGSLGCLEGVVV